MFIVLPIKIIAFGDFLLDFRLNFYYVFLSESLGSGLVLLSKNADVVIALEST